MTYNFSNKDHEISPSIEGLKYSTIFKRAGLNDNEAIVYETLLNRGQSGIAELQYLLPDIKRTNLYSVLYSLRDQGIVEQTIKNKKINFKAGHPENLYELISQSEINLSIAKREVSAVLPDLKSLYNLTTSKPLVRYYEGIEGIEKVYREINNSECKMI